VNKTKPCAKEIRKAREAAKHHRMKPGEKRAVAPRPLVSPTKKRLAGEASLTTSGSASGSRSARTS